MIPALPASTVVIFGAGKIGTACYTLLNELVRISRHGSWNFGRRAAAYSDLTIRLVDNQPDVNLRAGGFMLDVAQTSEADLVTFLKMAQAEYIINAMPFFLNVKLATAARAAGCAYIDFTEDDEAAEAVRNIYAGSELYCAPKCGLAPGFVNYAGAELVSQLRDLDPNITIHALQVRVGALAQNVSFTDRTLEEAYDLTWSIDGLVNEYIRPCQVREAGVECTVAALTGKETIVIDGTTYEARYTSGGVGTLIKDYPEIANIDYKTIRVPGHYEFVEGVVLNNGRNFEAIRDVFKANFSWTDKDVIVVFAKARGTDSNGTRHVRTFAQKFYGNEDLGLSAIQTTTAGGGLAVFELLRLRQCTAYTVGHTSLHLRNIRGTVAYSITYGGQKFRTGSID